MAFLPPWRRRTATFVTAVLAPTFAVGLVAPAVLLTSATALAQPTDNAKASLADANKAARAKDWATAAKLFDAANKTEPSAEALEGLASASYEDKQLGPAFNAYTEWLDKYGAKAPPAKKKAAEERRKELTQKTGVLTIESSEPGAAVLVDGKPVGTSPIASGVRVAAGTRRVQITKDGFLPIDESKDVTGGGAATVHAVLVPTATKGKLVVTVKSEPGRAVRVTVDGVDMGDAPWTGDVDPGPHEIGIRATALAATAQKVNVERGKSYPIELVASASTASVKIGTDDAKGLIYIDGKLVGEGSFIGDVPAGLHRLKITREGYDSFDEDITVKDKEPLARTITLKLGSKIETGVVKTTERLEGLYGGFSLLGVLTPGGTGNALEKQCDEKGKITELASCSAGDGGGGGLGGFIGYHWDPVGLELFLGGQYDQRTMNNDWNASSTDPGIGPDPARIEEFTLRRAGGLALARVRLTAQTAKFRFTFAAGAGVSYRVMFLDRITRAKDASGARDVYADADSYVAPVIALEPAAMYRLTPGVALSLGVQMFLETPSSFLNGRETPKTQPGARHALGLRGLSTPSYELAANAQIFIGPFIGMMFGP